MHGLLQRCCRDTSHGRHTTAEQNSSQTFASSSQAHTHTFSATGAPGPGHAGARAEGVQQEHAPPLHSAAGPAAAPRHHAAAPQQRVRPAAPATRTAAGGRLTPWGVPAQLQVLRSQHTCSTKGFHRSWLRCVLVPQATSHKLQALLAPVCPACARSQAEAVRWASAP